MKNEIMAANAIGIANLYNLQLFSDEEGTEIEEVVEQTETEEVANSEVEEIQGEVQTESKEDITQTQAFSRRLNEEREKFKLESEAKVLEAEARAIDRYIAKQYEGQLWKGKPITTQAELNQALYEQQLEQAGQSPEQIEKLINEHPSVRAAREAEAEASRSTSN